MFPKLIDPSLFVPLANPMPSNSGIASQTTLDSASTPDEEVDVISVNDKKYFCQRCLNHGEEHPRKGHKPFCRYASCLCTECAMVEHRRRLNYELSQAKKDPTDAKKDANGKRVRDPKCARCNAHGEKNALRGHKRATCPYNTCECHLCQLVTNRRELMAKQIKLRRDQQKAKKEAKETEHKMRSSVENHTPPGSAGMSISANPLISTMSLPSLPNFGADMTAFPFPQPTCGLAMPQSFMDMKFPVVPTVSASSNLMANFLPTTTQPSDLSLLNMNSSLTTQPSQIPMPNFAGMTIEQMRATLQIMKLSSMGQQQPNQAKPEPPPTLPTTQGCAPMGHTICDMLQSQILAVPIVNGCAGAVAPTSMAMSMPNAGLLGQQNLNLGCMKQEQANVTAATSPVLPQPQLLLNYPGVGTIPVQPNLLAALFQQQLQQLSSSQFLTPPMTPPNNPLVASNSLF